MSEQEMTGYPSLDKPWLKYYSAEAINAPLPDGTMFDLLYNSDKCRSNNTALKYFGNSISYGEMFKNIRMTAGALSAHGVKRGDVVSILSLNTPETTYVIYGLNLIGAVANLLVANMTPDEISKNVSETGSKLLFVLDRMTDGLANAALPIPVIELPIANSAVGLEKLLLNVSGCLKRSAASERQTFKEFVSKYGEAEKISEDMTNAPAVIL